MYYIQETDKPNLIFNILNIVQLCDDKIILPITGEEKIGLKKAQKLAQRTKKVLNRTISKKIVISNQIKKQEDYMNFLYTYEFEIVKGKWLFEILICKILDNILEKQGLNKKEIQISILVNDLSENMLLNIKKITKEYKRVNIITNHVEKLKKIEKKILEEDGIMITVGNNKKKGLSKSKLILNVDFPTELINLYNIFEEAIIVNLIENVKINKKRFNGITINDYDISFKDYEEFDYDKNNKYKSCEIYEAKINKKQPFQDVMKQIEKDKVEVIKLTGKNNDFK